MIQLQDPRVARFLQLWFESGRAEHERSVAFWERREGRPYPLPAYDENPDAKRTAHLRNKYIALDRGTSGVYLLERATGIVYAIKGYGVRGQYQGHLDELIAKFESALPPLPAPPPLSPPPAPEKPALPTVEALTEALRAAQAAALAAQPGDDGGTCNFDTPVLRPPGMRAALVRAAAAAAGVRVEKTEWMGPAWFVHVGVGQGNMRSRMCRAAYQALQAAGLDASEYLQMD